MKFPRNKGKLGGWTIKPDYLLKVSEKIKQLNDEEFFDDAPGLEQIEMVLLAIEEMHAG